MMRKVAQFGFANHLTLTLFHVLQEMDAERKGTVYNPLAGESSSHVTL